MNITRVKKRKIILVGLTSITTLFSTTAIVNINNVRDKTSPNYLSTNYSRSVNSIYGDHELIKDVKYQLNTSKKVTTNDDKYKTNSNKKAKDAN